MGVDGIAAKIRSLLREPWVRKVNFRINNLTVTGLGFFELSDAIGRGLIGSQIVPDIRPAYKGEHSPDTIIEARYDTEVDKMIIRRSDYGRYDGEERNMFHEATHALFDYLAGTDRWSGTRKPLGVDDETCAVLAEAYYMGLADSQKAKGNFEFEVGGRGQRAMEVFRMLEARTNRFQDMTVQVLRLGEYMLLHQAVAKDWGFDKHIDNKGLDTDGSGIIHSFDGVPERATRMAADGLGIRALPDWYGIGSKVK